DVEARAETDMALDDDVAAILLHDAVHHRETEARALATLLVRVERLEHAGERLEVHPRAGVAHAQEHVAARGDRAAAGLDRAVEVGRGDPHLEAATAGHRVASVH